LKFSETSDDLAFWLELGIHSFEESYQVNLRRNLWETFIYKIMKS